MNLVGLLKYCRVEALIDVRASNAVELIAWLMANGSCLVIWSVHRMALGSSDLMSREMDAMCQG